MKFSEHCSEFMSKNLLLNIEEFEATIESKFGGNAYLFDELVNFMLHDNSRRALPLLEACQQAIEFENFRSRCFEHIDSKAQLSENLIDYMFVIICGFGSFCSGGLVALFKHRQAEHDWPRIYLSHPLTERVILERYLDAEIVAYRGMSVAEFESGFFGMSWSLSEDKAREFAVDNYPDKPRGVVVQAIIPRDEVLYFNPEDNEQEIVVAYKTISSGRIIQK